MEQTLGMRSALLRKQKPMTQEELALHVNSVRETVGRMLKRFAAEGIIEIRRGAIRVLDMEKLEKQAK